MDQLKEQLAVVLRHGFWIGSLVVLLGTVAIWYLTTGTLVDETQKQTSKIKNDDSTVTSVRSDIATQPNKFSHEKMEKMIDDRTDEVVAGWRKVFNDQRDLLTWPTNEMSANIVDQFQYVKDENGNLDRNRLKLPVEQYVEFPPQLTEQIAPTVLNTYARYIGKVLPKIAEAGGTKWEAEFKGKRSGGGGMMDGMAGMGRFGQGGGNTGETEVTGIGADSGPVVAWSKASQEALLNDLFPWAGQDPKTLEVYYSQENLWILKQLMGIVKDVNGDAKQPFEAKIREIKSIKIGKSVQLMSNGKISKPGAKAAAGGMGAGGMEEMMMESGGMDFEMGGEMGGGYGDGGTEEAADPADGRYVNTAMEPINGSDLRGAFGNKSPDSVALAVVKRVPVMMSVQMDQRNIDDLLAACANAPLRVDVKHIREMPKGSGSSAGGMMGEGMGGGGMNEMMEDMGGMEEEMGGMGGGLGGLGGGRGAAAPIKEVEEYPADLDVEVYGIIHFYNPPDEETLGVDKVTDAVTLDSSVGETTDLPPPSADTPPATGTTPPADGTTPPTTGTTPPATGTTQPPTAAGQPPTGSAPPAGSSATAPVTAPAANN